MADPRRARSAPTGSSKRTKPWWIIAAIAGVIVIGAAFASVSPFVAGIAIALALGLGIAAFAGHPIRWLGLRSRGSGFAALGVAGLLVIGAGASGAAETPSPEAAAPAAFAVLPAQDAAAGNVPEPEPTPTPTVSTVTEEREIDFTRTTIDDPDRDKGEQAIITEGVVGVLETTYAVTTLDGEEIAREMVSERVSVEPIDEVTAIGTRVPPPAAPAPVPVAPQKQAKAACDPNYTGACVPIASDVDCAGGSGNGPAYVKGPVRVVGTDIYKLDRDGDGIACD